jgi:hypothetical protein
MPSQLTSPRVRALAVVAALAASSASVTMLAGCTRGEPPAFDSGARSPVSAVSSSAGSSSAVSTPSIPTPSFLPSAGAATDAGATSAIVDASVGVDAGALPQTRDRPAANGAAFDARVAALWDAIVKDDPERALPFFFPRAAYAQVKDVGDPARDWRLRLVAAYAKDIHELHAAVGKDATFVSLDVPDARARWVEPGEEYNKLGYWRVYGSKLRWDTVSATHRSADVKSLISWRGEWYVVHLSAIK